MVKKTHRTSFELLLICLTLITFVSCKKNSDPNYLEFYKINIVSPNPKATFDSIQNKYGLPIYWDYEEGNGYASGGLALANGFLDIKTYYDNSVTKASPMELVLNSSLPDSITVQKLQSDGLKANKPFRMEGWFWSVVSISDLKIIGDESNGVYVTHYDDYNFHKRSADSIKNLTDKRIDSIIIYSKAANELKTNWEKIKLKNMPPIVIFIEDDINRIELVIK
jgi:vacuolar-type H+-ATPase subunit F/Vma7